MPSSRGRAKKNSPSPTSSTPGTADDRLDSQAFGTNGPTPLTGEITRSFAILTTVANELMQAIGHHRSPVVLDEEQEQAWVNLSTPLSDITGMLRPCPAAKLNAYPISPDIRDPRANGSDLLQPTGARVYPEYDFEIHQELEMFGMDESRARNRQSSAPGAQGSLF